MHRTDDRRYAGAGRHCARCGLSRICGGICEDMMEARPKATMLNYVNLDGDEYRAMYARYPHIKQVGLRHSAVNGVRTGARPEYRSRPPAIAAPAFLNQYGVLPRTGAQTADGIPRRSLS